MTRPRSRHVADVGLDKRIEIVGVRIERIRATRPSVKRRRDDNLGVWQVLCESRHDVGPVAEHRCRSVKSRREVVDAAKKQHDIGLARHRADGIDVLRKRTALPACKRRYAERRSVFRRMPLPDVSGNCAGRIDGVKERVRAIPRLYLVVAPHHLDIVSEHGELLPQQDTVICFGVAQVEALRDGVAVGHNLELRTRSERFRIIDS